MSKKILCLLIMGFLGLYCVPFDSFNFNANSQQTANLFPPILLRRSVSEKVQDGQVQEDFENIDRYIEKLSEYFSYVSNTSLTSVERRTKADEFRKLIESIADYDITYDELLDYSEILQEMVYGFEVTDGIDSSMILLTLSYPGDISGGAEGFWNYLVIPWEGRVLITRLNETGDIILTQMDVFNIPDTNSVLVHTAGIKRGWYPYQQISSFWVISEGGIQQIEEIDTPAMPMQILGKNGEYLGKITTAQNELIFEPQGEVWIYVNIEAGILSLSADGLNTLWQGNLSYLEPMKIVIRTQ